MLSKNTKKKENGWFMTSLMRHEDLGPIIGVCLSLNAPKIKNFKRKIYPKGFIQALQKQQKERKEIICDFPGVP